MDIFTTGRTLSPAERLASAHAMLAIFGGVDMKTAEEAVEDIRKVLWMAAFSGAGIEEVFAAFGRHPIAKTLAMEMSDLTLLTVEDILQEARFGFYVGAYSNDPNSRFGKLVASGAVERARYAGKPAGNA